MSDLELPLIIEPGELLPVLGRGDLLIVALGDGKGLAKLVRAQRCVPGAVHLDTQSIVAARPPVMGLVPDERQLGDALSSIGLTAEKHVVAYDALGNTSACRFLWTLDLVGHRGYSLLNGGLGGWLDEGHPTERRFAKPPVTNVKVRLQAGPMAEKDYILAHLDDPDVVILDTRTPAEFGSEAIQGLGRSGPTRPVCPRSVETKKTARTQALPLRPRLAIFGALPQRGLSQRFG